MADKITKAVDASPYPKAPSIWIAYPQLDDWKRLFVPVLDPKRAIDAHWLQAKYAFMKSRHETFVTSQLDAIIVIAHLPAAMLTAPEALRRG